MSTSQQEPEPRSPREPGVRPEPDPWRANEESRRRQLREDGRRALGVNLAEGLALSEFLSRFTGAARKS